MRRVVLQLFFVLIKVAFSPVFFFEKHIKLITEKRRYNEADKAGS